MDHAFRCVQAHTLQEDRSAIPHPTSESIPGADIFHLRRRGKLNLRVVSSAISLYADFYPLCRACPLSTCRS